MKSEADLPEYLTLQDVSKILKVHPNTLRAWDNKGMLKADRIGVKRLRRYKRHVIEDFIKKNNQEQ